MADVLVSLGFLKHGIVWCLIFLVGDWLYLLYRGSYGGFACMSVFVLIAAYAMMDDFVSSDIATRDHFLLPDLE